MLCVDLKFLLYSINGVVFVFALVLISMGVNCTTIPGPTINGTQSSIIFGTSMILLGGLGITSVRLRQFWLSILFMIILICLLGGQLVMGIKALAMDESAVIKSYLKKLYSSKSKDEVSANVSRIQGYFKCCGYYGPDSNFCLQDFCFLWRFTRFNIADPDVWLKDPIYLSKGEWKCEYVENSVVYMGF